MSSNCNRFTKSASCTYGPQAMFRANRIHHSILAKDRRSLMLSEAYFLCPLDANPPAVLRESAWVFARRPSDAKVLAERWRPNYSRALRIAAITRGSRLPWITATTDNGFSSGA
jgi:hypothetical protein